MAGSNLCRAFPGLGDGCGDGLTLLFKRNTSSGALVNILAIVSPHLESQNDVKNQCEEETRQNERVLDLRGGGKQSGETAKDLRHNGKGGQLPSRLCPVVLCDLGEFGEQPKREGSHLEERDGFLGKVNQCTDRGGERDDCAGNLWQVARSGR